MIYKFDKFSLDDQTKRLEIDGQMIGLSEVEYRVLLELLSHWPQCTTIEALLCVAREIDDFETTVKRLLGVIDQVTTKLRLHEASTEIIGTNKGHPKGNYISVDVSKDSPDSPKARPLTPTQWIPLVNQIEGVEVQGLLDSLPEVKLVGVHPISKNLNQAIRSKINELDFDTCQAGVPEVPLLINGMPVKFNASKIKYSAASVLRSINKSPFIVTGNIVLICKARQCVILNIRSSISETFKNCIHTIGGAFDIKDSNLRRTVARDLLQQADICISIGETIPMLFACETSNRFLQVVFLGVDISEAQFHKLVPNRSREIVLVSFDDLKTVLIQGLPAGHNGSTKPTAWVPSGKAHILSWLACGAPGVDPGTTFNGVTAQALFREISSRALHGRV